MNMNTKIFFALIFSIVLFTSFKEQDELYIWYNYEVGIVKTCDGQEVEFEMEINTKSIEKVKIHSFNLEQLSFKIYNNNKLISAKDTLILTKNRPIKLKVIYKIMPRKALTFNFKTNRKKYYDNTVHIIYGTHIIESKNIREAKEQYVNITESCQDSISVYFPEGGTVSSATIYTDSSATKKEFKSISYGLGDSDNFITFSKSDIGRYYVDYGSCHWGGNFWLTIK